MVVLLSSAREVLEAEPVVDLVPEFQVAQVIEVLLEKYLDLDRKVAVRCTAGPGTRPVDHLDLNTGGGQPFIFKCYSIGIDNNGMFIPEAITLVLLLWTIDSQKPYFFGIITNISKLDLTISFSITFITASEFTFL